MEFTAKSGQKFNISAGPPLDWPRPLYVIAAHKTGSVLLNRIVHDICRKAGISDVSVEEETYRQGIPVSDWPAELYTFLMSPYVFRGFRGLHRLPNLDGFTQARKIFLVRDPRDVATSFYFSMKKSHVMPDAGKTRFNLEERRREANLMNINEFIIDGRTDFIMTNMLKFLPYRGDEGAVIYRYEDVIFSKEQWVLDLCRRLTANLSNEEAGAIAAKHDVVPDREDPESHIRQVKPGNYKFHLGEEAIAYLRGKFGVLFDAYGYQ